MFWSLLCSSRVVRIPMLIPVVLQTVVCMCKVVKEGGLVWSHFFFYTDICCVYLRRRYHQGDLWEEDKLAEVVWCSKVTGYFGNQWPKLCCRSRSPQHDSYIPSSSRIMQPSKISQTFPNSPVCAACCKKRNSLRVNLTTCAQRSHHACDGVCFASTAAESPQTDNCVKWSYSKISAVLKVFCLKFGKWSLLN